MESYATDGLLKEIIRFIELCQSRVFAGKIENECYRWLTEGKLDFLKDLVKEEQSSTFLENNVKEKYESVYSVDNVICGR